MARYRQLLEDARQTPPLVPFFPLLMKDLACLHMGNQSESEGLINFDKLRMLSKFISDNQQMSETHYDRETLLRRNPTRPLGMKAVWKEAEATREAKYFSSSFEQVQYSTPYASRCIAVCLLSQPDAMWVGVTVGFQQG